MMRIEAEHALAPVGLAFFVVSVQTGEMFAAGVAAAVVVIAGVMSLGRVVAEVRG